jgi:hypothetical protein
MIPPRWVLADQAAIDACAEDLYAAGFDCRVLRGHDEHGGEIRKLEIYLPDRQVDAELGLVVIMLFGTLQVITAEQYADSPFYEAP